MLKSYDPRFGKFNSYIVENINKYFSNNNDENNLKIESKVILE